MFYDHDYSVWYMIVFWVTVTAVFGVSLHFSLKLAHIDLGRIEELYAIVIPSLVALVPAIGPYLAFVVAIIMIYRMADAGLGMVIGAVVLTRFIAIGIAIGLLRALVAVGVLTE